MGHDITALRPGIDRSAEFKKVEAVDYDDDRWDQVFQTYQDRCFVAYLRRSAFNPLNRVIYIVLGVEDQAYVGCSGNGEMLKIGLDQFHTALELLDRHDWTQIRRTPNAADELAMALGAVFGNALMKCEPQTLSIEPEKEFLLDCIAFCEENAVDQLEVCFS